MECYAKNADSSPVEFDLLITKMLEGWEVTHPKGRAQRNNRCIISMLFENGQIILVDNKDGLQSTIDH
jgi:hypothetical protein